MTWHRMQIIVNICTWLQENSHKVTNIISIYLSTLNFVCYIVVSKKKKPQTNQRTWNIQLSFPVHFYLTFSDNLAFLYS